LVGTIESHLADARRGEIVRSGIKLSIFGPPNAGKSSLLNFLCRYFTVARLPYRVHPIFSTAQREAAIVTPIPGTTRDILSLSLDIGGLPIIISDTAGLRQTQDVVESIGIERAHQA
jgi:tRNA modification GTPase